MTDCIANSVDHDHTAWIFGLSTVCPGYKGKTIPAKGQILT